MAPRVMWQCNVQLTKDHVITWVKSALSNRKIEARVVVDGVQDDDNFWYVPVTEEDKNGPRFDYYQMLSGIERDFELENPDTFMIIIPERAS